MKIHSLIWGILILTLVFSCNRKSGKAKVGEVQPIEAETVDATEDLVIDTIANTVDEDEGPEPVYVLCELQRTSCYGKCPTFKIKLYSDGKVIYQGKANVERMGRFVAFCEPQQFESIFTAAEQANYFVLRSQYPEDGRKLSDLPKTITYLKRNGLEKRVINNFDAPADLVQFEHWLDDFFASLDWKPARGGN